MNIHHEKVNQLRELFENTNMDNDSMLSFACKLNEKLEVIVYLFDVLQIDINHVNNHGYNALMVALIANCDLEVIKYLVEIVNIDPHKMDYDGRNAFAIACAYNEHLEVIKYFVESKNFKLEYYDPLGIHFNAFLSACANNNVNIVKYLIEDIKMYPKCTYNNTNMNGLMVALMCEKNIDMIKYLLHDLKIDPYETDINGNNAFYFACEYRYSSFENLKYLFENYDIFTLNPNDDDSFDSLVYIMTYKNEHIMPYMLSLLKNSHCIKFCFKFCVKLVIESRKKMNNSNKHMYFAYKSDYIFSMLKSFESPFVHLWNDNDGYYDFHDVVEIFEYLIKNNMHDVMNENLLKIENVKYCCIEYDRIKNVMNYINFVINVQYDEHSAKNKMFKSLFDEKDLTDKLLCTDLTFIVNFDDEKNVEYCGSKMIIYKLIEMFKILSNNGIERCNGLYLTIEQPKHVFDFYIKAQYIGYVNIEDWCFDDVIHFLNLIDMYPSKCITIEKIQHHVIKYYKNNECKITSEQYHTLMEICDRCELTLLLIMLNNIKVNGNIYE
jgi:hypothetical protein